jgi:hypothetical protein
MSGRRVWIIPLLVLGLVLGTSAAGAQEKGPPASAPVKEGAKVLSPKELADYIDQQISAKWAKAKITAAHLADDAEFVRRIYLDLSGRIPKVADAREFFDDKSADKREKLIDELLDGPQYVDHFSNTWRAVMIPGQSNPQASFLGRNFQMWMVERLRQNTPYDRLVHEILTVGTKSNQPQPGKGGGFPGYNIYNSGAFAFFQVNENKPENLAAATSRVFLGVRLECAQCHNHPFTDWKKEQFWEFAAFFSSPTPGVFVPQPVGQQPQPPLPKGVITIPGTGKKVSAKYLDGKAPVFKADVHVRETLAEWVTSPSNPYFARNAANRIWGQLFGIGLIDPVDDEPTKDNPPSHPELLHTLAEQFVAHEFDTKYLIRAITLSRTYQRTSKQSHDSQKNLRLFAKGAVRGLSAEQLFDSLARATGYFDNGSNQPVYFYNINSVRARFVADFSSTDYPTETTTSILQALKLMNGKFIADATSLEKSHTLAAVAESPFFNTAEKVQTLFLATLTRLPTDAEAKQFVSYVNSGGPRQDQKAALGDVFWALLNCSEFRLNH